MMQKLKSGIGRFIFDLSRSHPGTHARGRIPLKEWSARCRGRYLHNTQKIQDTKNHTISGIRIPDRSSSGQTSAVDSKAKVMSQLLLLRTW